MCGSVPRAGAAGVGDLQAFLDGFAHGLRDSLVARVGVALVSRGGGGVGRWAALLRQSRATATVKGKVKSLKSASGGACAASGLAPGSGGPRSRAAVVACGRLCPGFPAASAPGGNHPGLGGVKPDHCCWPPVPSGWTPPRPGWLCKHRRSDGESGTTPVCGVDGVHSVRTRCGNVTGTRRGDPSHRRGCPGSLVAVGGPCQSFRTGGVKSDETAPQQRVIRLDTARPG